MLVGHHNVEVMQRFILQVASTGDVVYALPEDFQATLRARSWWLRAQPALQQVISRTRPCPQPQHRCRSAVWSHEKRSVPVAALSLGP